MASPYAGTFLMSNFFVEHQVKENFPFAKNKFLEVLLRLNKQMQEIIDQNNRENFCNYLKQIELDEFLNVKEFIDALNNEQTRLNKTTKYISDFLELISKTEDINFSSENYKVKRLFNTINPKLLNMLTMKLEYIADQLNQLPYVKNFIVKIENVDNPTFKYQFNKHNYSAQLNSYITSAKKIETQILSAQKDVLKKYKKSAESEFIWSVTGAIGGVLLLTAGISLIGLSFLIPNPTSFVALFTMAVILTPTVSIPFITAGTWASFKFADDIGSFKKSLATNKLRVCDLMLESGTIQPDKSHLVDQIRPK